ncbi:phage tail assembly chaperone [Pseudomonas aeruginosa]|uniref:phage tail assembly chaperone n=1 Tax=Pseudomonas TaxID=286 RepID=UPI0003BB0051|nr:MULTISPECIES: phage tail assembly chaperone [Pseudomonas]EIU3154830.1 phage tail protein [Pseudomonas aeruginosa]EIU4713333.1 phage tail protein [Pseudomonas aeruginosa]EKF8202795.1 phage tail protein [Pseudomonas aeruginosa]EKI0125533.1 phage tail protein [Pseudomonas aeruginosa]EKU4102964.1 phage tail protein [Pseudomonas aeruginosa]
MNTSDYVFSPSAAAFYPVSLREAYESGNGWPADGIPVSAEVHARILQEQEAGRVICAGPDGQPMTKEPPPPSTDELAAIERAWRDHQLDATDALVARHRDEIEDGDTTLTGEQYQALQAYRRTLRDWPEQGEFPLAEHRPSAPAWLAEELERDGRYSA